MNGLIPRQSKSPWGLSAGRRLYFPLVLAALMVFGMTTARGATAQDAQHFIEELAHQAITTVAAQNIPDDQRRQHFRQLFVSAFDLPDIGKFVLSRYWRTATPQQRDEFLKQFEDMQVLVWSDRFKEYHGETLEALGATKDTSGDWLVNSRILRPNNPPIPVQWRVHEAPGGALRIVDIIPENVSMALTQRQDFAGVLQSNGGNIDALLSTMRAKNNQLAKAP